MKTIMVIAGGTWQVPLIKRAKETRVSSCKYKLI